MSPDGRFGQGIWITVLLEVTTDFPFLIVVVEMVMVSKQVSVSLVVVCFLFRSP